jgi:hypothetical protein
VTEEEAVCICLIFRLALLVRLVRAGLPGASFFAGAVAVIVAAALDKTSRIEWNTVVCLLLFLDGDDDDDVSLLMLLLSCVVALSPCHKTDRVFREEIMIAKSMAASTDCDGFGDMRIVEHK